MEKLIRVAIDGPAGAVKSTMAKLLAKELGIEYIDTGAMYRAIALKLIRTGTDYNDPEALDAVLKTTDVDFSDGKVMLDGEPAEAYIRTPEVSEMASASSAVLAVREKLVALQRAMGQRKSVVMDGRDIGTNVLKDAECKIYLDASPRVRAERRAKELAAKGLPCDVDAVEEDIRQRDYRDMHREHNPLAKADDAAVIDSSYLTIPQVVEIMRAVIEEKTR